MTKAALCKELQRNQIAMNVWAEKLFDSDLFTVSALNYSARTVELTVGNLGFWEGAEIAPIFEKAQALGLGLCPPELGPYLRLQTLDQLEGFWGMPMRKNQAPSGSITIGSKPLSDDNEFPKGFYLRRIEGVLCLRGYRSGPEHIWAPDDHFVFLVKEI